MSFRKAYFINFYRIENLQKLINQLKIILYFNAYYSDTASYIFKHFYSFYKTYPHAYIVENKPGKKLK